MSLVEYIYIYMYINEFFFYFIAIYSLQMISFFSQVSRPGGYYFPLEREI